MMDSPMDTALFQPALAVYVLVLMGTLLFQYYLLWPAVLRLTQISWRYSSLIKQRVWNDSLIRCELMPLLNLYNLNELLLDQRLGKELCQQLKPHVADIVESSLELYFPKINAFLSMHRRSQLVSYAQNKLNQVIDDCLDGLRQQDVQSILVKQAQTPEQTDKFKSKHSSSMHPPKYQLDVRSPINTSDLLQSLTENLLLNSGYAITGCAVITLILLMTCFTWVNQQSLFMICSLGCTWAALSWFSISFYSLCKTRLGLCQNAVYWHPWPHFFAGELSHSVYHLRTLFLIWQKPGSILSQQLRDALEHHYGSVAVHDYMHDQLLSTLGTLVQQPEFGIEQQSRVKNWIAAQLSTRASQSQLLPLILQSYWRRQQTLVLAIGGALLILAAGMYFYA